MPEGDSILLFWIHLLCLAGETNDSGLIYISEDLFYTPEMLSQICDLSIPTIKLALTTLARFDMISYREDGLIEISSWSETQSVDKLDEIREQNRLRKQRQRERQKYRAEQISLRKKDVLELPGQITEKEAGKEEKSIQENLEQSDCNDYKRCHVTSRDSHVTVTPKNKNIDIDKDIDINNIYKNNNIYNTQDILSSKLDDPFLDGEKDDKNNLNSEVKISEDSQKETLSQLDLNENQSKLKNINNINNNTTQKQNKTENGEIPYKAIIRYLNNVVGANFNPGTKETRKLIKERWQEGYRLQDFIRVIENKYVAWRNDPKMAKYLRPKTLFGDNFEAYLNEQQIFSKNKSKYVEYAYSDVRMTTEEKAVWAEAKLKYDRMAILEGSLRGAKLESG